MKLVNRVSRYSVLNGTSFMDALRSMMRNGECTAEDAQSELVPRGILGEDDIEELRELQKYAEAMKADAEFEANIHRSPYGDYHPMGIFQGMDDEVAENTIKRHRYLLDDFDREDLEFNEYYIY